MCGLFQALADVIVVRTRLAREPHRSVKGLHHQEVCAVWAEHDSVRKALATTWAVLSTFNGVTATGTARTKMQFVVFVVRGFEEGIRAVFASHGTARSVEGETRNDVEMQIEILTLMEILVN